MDLPPNSKLWSYWSEPLYGKMYVSEIYYNIFLNVFILSSIDVTKLKYVGVPTHDLIDIYKLFFRSLLEYCCVSWHSSQYSISGGWSRTCSKNMFQSDPLSILHKLWISVRSLWTRKAIWAKGKRCLKFGLQSLKHLKQKLMFPANEVNETNSL